MGELNWMRLVFAWGSIGSTVIERTELSMNMYSKTNLKLDEKLAWSPESKESKVCNIFSNWGYKAKAISLMDLSKHTKITDWYTPLRWPF